jgi:predicted nucleotidyltransferase
LHGAAVAAACRRRGVARLRVFGSAATNRFDPVRSDIDLLVDFRDDVDDLLGAYLGLKGDLEAATSREVDLVMSGAVKNPYFAAQAFSSAHDVFNG